MPPAWHTRFGTPAWSLTHHGRPVTFGTAATPADAWRAAMLALTSPGRQRVADLNDHEYGLWSDVIVGPATVCFGEYTVMTGLVSDRILSYTKERNPHLAVS